MTLPIIPIIPLYIQPLKKIYCNFVYHNDRFNLQGGTRNEYRIYCNREKKKKIFLFQEDDILIFRPEKATLLQNELTADDVPETAVADSKVYFLFRCFRQDSKLYKRCSTLIDNSSIRGNGHAIYEGTLEEVENEIKESSNNNFDEIDTIIDDTVTAKAQAGDISAMANLFNSVSFRDFVMTGYEYCCAITGNVIRYGSLMNLEAAHIWPKSHNGLYLPSNGIALCRDMHWAFDKGMFTIGDNLRVIVHPDINSAHLRQYHNKQIFIPKNDFFKPDINNLHYHQSTIFGLFKTSGSLTKAKYFNYTAYSHNMVAEQHKKYGK